MASAEFAGTYTITDGTSMNYATTGRYLTFFKVGGAREEMEEFVANGVDGIGTKNHGARETMYTLQVHIVDSTEAACVTGLADMIDDLAGSGTFTFTIAGRTGTGRIIAEQSAVSQPKNNGGGTFRAESLIVIRRLRGT